MVESLLSVCKALGLIPLGVLEEEEEGREKRRKGERGEEEGRERGGRERKKGEEGEGIERVHIFISNQKL